ncbi:MAG TPA: hypothetical protein VF796_16410 [Humisphaera sp.]
MFATRVVQRRRSSFALRAAVGFAASAGAIALLGCDRAPGVRVPATAVPVADVKPAEARVRASGLLVVRSPRERPEPNKAVPAVPADEAAQLVEAHALTIVHPSTLQEALADPDGRLRRTAWFRGLAGDAERVKDLQDHLTATPAGKTRLVRVEFSAASGADAREVLEAVVEAYLAKLDAQYEVEEKTTMSLLQQEKARLEFELDQVVRRQLSAKEQELGMEGVEVFGAYNVKRQRYERVLNEATQVREALAGLTARKDSIDRALRDGKVPPEIGRLVTSDPRYLQAKSRADEAEIDVALLAADNGEKHESVAKAKKRLAVLQERLKRVQEELRAEHADAVRQPLENQIASAQANASLLRKDVDDFNVQMGRLNQMVQQYQLLKTKEARLRDDITQYDRDIRRVAEFRLGLGKARWRPVDWQARPAAPGAPAPAAAAAPATTTSAVDRHPADAAPNRQV